MNMAVLLGINGDLGSTIMMLHGMTLLVLTSIYEETWPNALVVFVVKHLI